MSNSVLETWQELNNLINGNEIEALSSDLIKIEGGIFSFEELEKLAPELASLCEGDFVGPDSELAKAIIEIINQKISIANGSPEDTPILVL